MDAPKQRFVPCGVRYFGAFAHLSAIRLGDAIGAGRPRSPPARGIMSDPGLYGGNF